ncbi:MAG TPA: TonB-dependent receptor, partial [Nitrosomonas nitrosa]|nr:TonB-dependent receptor [Nitrosomonas nitrosa]
RPVEALKDIQKSIELNDNRAVYRSKLLLDQDQAGRGSSLARIFDNLGFEKRAIMETAKSLAFDPSNHSAHRFLADTYANIPRHEAARVSELLQAQLMQPINVNPVQPHLAVADLNIITNTGPTGAGFNEFAPLMERNRSQFVASGFGGNNSTFGNEIVFSKLYERTSVSLGQFHYQTDGFRTNNAQNHDILNAFIQHAVTPKLNIQAEVRTRTTDQGNLLLDFDRDSDDPIAPKNRVRRRNEEDMARVGARYKLTPNQNILISSQFTDKKIQNTGPHFDTFLQRTANLVTFTKDKGYQNEIQYQLRNNHFNIIAGAGVYQINRTENRKTVNLENEPINCCLTDSFSRTKKSGYVYTNFNFNPRLTASVGFSYDSFKDRSLTLDRFNPKLGLQWNLTNEIRLRFAWIETVKTPLITNQTIEPTQVAGFNQIFDDPSGTKSSRIGIGIDTYLGKKIFGGIELSSRNLQVPIHNLENLSFSFEDQKEKLYRTYLYGTLHQNWAVTGEMQFEQFSRAEAGTAPHEINTLSTPVGINYFNPRGLFANLTGTFVLQEIDRLKPENENEGTEKFFLLDAALGYRFPNRKGILSVEAKNILDQAFLFRNINFFTSEPINPRFVPTRTIFARLTLNF